MTRRELISTLFVKLGAVAIIATIPRSAFACLSGTWFVRCPNGHVDQVDDITCQHECNTCHAQAFSGGNVTVVCPKGHDNPLVNTGSKDQAKQCQFVKSFKCTYDGLECCQRAYDPPWCSKAPSHPPTDRCAKC
jgi:hypothetical protein